MEHFTRSELKKAKQCDLYNFLLSHHPDLVKREGHSLRMLENNSLSIKEGWCGYHDFSTGENGNTVDFLTKHLGYGFVDAVLTLSNEESVAEYERKEQREFVIPAKTEGAFGYVFSYLKRRGISHDTLIMLCHKGLLYQEAETNNAIFLNRERSFYESRGTCGRYHKVIRKNPADFWYFSIGNEASKIYVCESCIDAISLYELLKDNNAFYVGIGGITNQRCIDRIGGLGFETIIAVDNDGAGELCRKRNEGYKSIIPVLKDWNEDLLNKTKGE